MERQSYLSTREVMALLHKTRNTMCEWVRQGKFPAIRVGNEYMFDPRVVAAWLEKRQTAKPIGARAA